MSPMGLVNSTVGWLWRNKLFVLVIVLSAGLFTMWNFPFNDLSDALTSAVARATGNQVYFQAEQLNIHLVPQPAVSAENVHVETSLPPLEAKWAKITPGLFSILFNVPTLIKAAGGDATAAQSLGSKLSVNVDAEGVMGGDVSLSMGGGKKSEGGKDRSRIEVTVSKVDLKDVGKWAELPMNLQGRANFATDVQFSPDFQEQPEGEYDFKISKFVMPAGTINVPMGEASMPISLPALTLANVSLRGRVVGGNLIIEEGMFGQSQDPLFGRIKGQMAMRLMPAGGGFAPQFGTYNLTVDLTTNATVQKEIGFAFLLLDSAKEPQANGGAKYLFKASGQGIGMYAAPPTITRVPSF